MGRDDRVTQILYNGATTCTPSAGTCIQYGYDTDGNLTSTIDATGTTTYFYDQLSRLTTIDLPGNANACPGSSPYGITYTYDPASNLTGYCDAGGHITYSYDAANRMTGLAGPGGNCTAGSVVQPCTSYTYDSDNRPTTITYPTSTGVVDTIRYNNAGNETSYQATNSAGTTLAGATYAWAQGVKDQPLVQTVDNLATGTTTAYTYTTLDQLQHAADTGGDTSTWSYSYDVDGDLTGQTTPTGTTTLAYNNADQLSWTLPTATTPTCGTPPGGATTYTYDPDGNQTGDSAGLHETYNTLNQTTGIQPACGCLSSYTYTGADSTRRVTSTTGGITTTYTNNLAGVASATTSGTTSYYTYDPSNTLTSEQVGSSRYYYLHDAAGSVTAMFDTNGNSVATYTYDPYGNTLHQTGSQATANPYRYESGYTDQTGYTKFGTRYYNPTLTAWTQPDPSGINPGYTYADDNPTNLADLSGLEVGCFSEGDCSTYDASDSSESDCLLGSYSGGGCVGGSIAGDIAGGAENVVDACGNGFLKIGVYLAPTTAIGSAPFEYGSVSGTLPETAAAAGGTLVAGAVVGAACIAGS